MSISAEYQRGLVALLKGWPDKSAKDDFYYRCIDYHLNASIFPIEEAEKANHARTRGLHAAAKQSVAAVAMDLPSDDLSSTAASIVMLAAELGCGYRDSVLLTRIIAIEAIISLLSQRATNDGGVHRMLASAQECLSSKGVLCSFESLLDADAAGLYGKMNEATKHLYRCRVDCLSSKSRITANEVLAAAGQLESESAAAGSVDDSNIVTKHIGYWLIGDGASSLNRLIGLDDTYDQRSVLPSGYWISVLTLCFATAIVVCSLIINELSMLAVVAAMILSTFLVEPIELVHRTIVSKYIGTRQLCSMEYEREGIPDEHMTVIAVPIVLHSSFRLDDFIRRLERNYVITNDSSVMMVVLADFIDSPTNELSASESELLERLTSKVEDLDQKHIIHSGKTCFACLHRPRQFSRADNEWRGYERKRGKLRSLAALILGNESELIYRNYCVLSRLRVARYMYCIDEDTLLTRKTIRSSVEVISHPLNQPRICNEAAEGAKRVIGVAAVLPAVLQDRRSLLSYRWPELVSTQHIDADSLRDSAEYESDHFNIFGREPYRGKGLLDVRSYYHLCGDLIPAGIVLSHDTIEGGLLSPVFCGRASIAEAVMVDEGAKQARSTRWMRGDLQNLALIVGPFWELRNALPGWCKLAIWNQVYSAFLPVVLFITTTIYLVLGDTVGELGVVVAVGFVAIALARAFVALQGAQRVYGRPPIAKAVMWMVVRTAYAWAMIPVSAVSAVWSALVVLHGLGTRRGLLAWTTSSSEHVVATVSSRYALFVRASTVGAIALLICLAFLGRLTVLSSLLLGGWSLAWPLASASLRRVGRTDLLRQS